MPDELFAPGTAWQELLEEDPSYAGLAFFPYIELGERSEVAVIPFQIFEERLEDLRFVIPSYLMSVELADWLVDFRDEVTSRGGRVTAESYSLSVHILVREMPLASMISFLEEALTVDLDMLIMPINNTQWRRSLIGCVRQFGL